MPDTQIAVGGDTLGQRLPADGSHSAETQRDGLSDVTPKESVLIVDDDSVCREVLSKTLDSVGYACEVAESGLSALEKLRTRPFDLMISDIKMPGMDGLELFAEVRKSDADMAVVMMTAFATFNSAVDALKLGASDYVTKPFNLEHVRISVERALERRRLIVENRRYQAELEQHRDELQDQVRERTAGLEQALEDLKEANRDTVNVLAKAAETNDEDTGNHIKRVAVFACTIASRLGLNGDTIEELGYASELHDVGKVATHPDILRKPGKLTDEEFDEMRKHTTRGAQILESVAFLQTAKEIALNHHERYNGKGYPRGISGGDIPTSARITALADVFDALTSHRCYRAAMPIEKALDIIREERGEHFDPEVHDAFFDVLDEILKMKERHEDE